MEEMNKQTARGFRVEDALLLNSLMGQSRNLTSVVVSDFPRGHGPLDSSRQRSEPNPARCFHL